MLRKIEQAKGTGSAKGCLMRKWQWAVLKEAKEGAIGYLWGENCGQCVCHDQLRMLDAQPEPNTVFQRQKRQQVQSAGVKACLTSSWERAITVAGAERAKRVIERHEMREGIGAQMNLSFPFIIHPDWFYVRTS